MTADKYKGVVEIEILGEVRGFKFGTAYLAMLCELEGVKLSTIIRRFSDPEDIAIKLKHYYVGAVQYVRLKNAEEKKGLPEPTYEQVCNWVDSLDQEQRNKIDETAFSKYQDPNTTAPQTEGQI